MADRICTAPGCTNRTRSRDRYCGKHRQRLQRLGSLDLPRTLTPQERFWAKVDKNGPSGCWLWTAGMDGKGYGRFREHKNEPTTGAHRYSYEDLVGPIPEGLHIDHLCRNPPCVNPAHLEPVTPGENVLRGEGPSARQARRTHCKRGHALPPARLGLKRQCVPCKRAWQRAMRARRREAAS